MSASSSAPTYEETTVSGHFRHKWEQRSARPSLDPRIAWLEAVPVHYPSMKPPAKHARLHEVTDLLLLGEPDGCLVTCIKLQDRSRKEQRYIRNQVSDYE